MGTRERAAPRLTLIVTTWLLISCTDTGDARTDTGRTTGTNDGGGDSACRSDDDCSDGLFCDGVERCLPSSASADSHGCLRGDPPCTPMQTCDEVRDQCLSNCDRTPDADGDGHRATNCGGDDCDDADPQRFPGNTEVCDTMRPAHDEDCDPMTFANSTTRDGDRDMDGFVNARCCNEDRNGMRACGLDCDDMNRDVRPSQAEACNGRDDNCNDRIDEGIPTQTCYRDGDMDGHGDPRATRDTCAPQCPAGWLPATAPHGDCCDRDTSVHPGQTQGSIYASACGNFDYDCNGSSSPSGPCMFPSSAFEGRTNCWSRPPAGVTCWPCEFTATSAVPSGGFTAARNCTTSSSGAFGFRTVCNSPGMYGAMGMVQVLCR